MRTTFRTFFSRSQRPANAFVFLVVVLIPAPAENVLLLFVVFFQLLPWSALIVRFPPFDVVREGLFASEVVSRGNISYRLILAPAKRG